MKALFLVHVQQTLSPCARRPDRPHHGGQAFLRPREVAQHSTPPGLLARCLRALRPAPKSTADAAPVAR